MARRAASTSANSGQPLGSILLPHERQNLAIHEVVFPPALLEVLHSAPAPKGLFGLGPIDAIDRASIEAGVGQHLLDHLCHVAADAREIGGGCGAEVEAGG